MANLVQKTEHILINTLTAKDFGVYSNVLLYKGSEHNAPYSIPKDKIVRKFFSKHRDPQKGSYLMELVAPAPCEDCDYSTGLSIGFKKHWNGNVWDSNPHFRYINGFLPSIGSAVSGELNSDDKKALLEQMINSINADKGNPAWATMAYVVTDEDTTDASTLDITVDGTTVTVSDTNDLANAINGDSDLAEHVVAYHLEEGTSNTDRVIIVGKNDKGYFNVEDGTDTSVDNFYLKLSEREYNKPMQIKWTEHQQDWNPVSRVFQWEVDYDSDQNLTFTGDDTTENSAFDHDTNIATTIANIVDVDNVAAVNLTDDSGSTTDNIGIFAYNFNNAKLVVADEDSPVPEVKYGNPQYGHLTGYDIHQIFPHVGDTQGIYPNLPDPDSNYCQIHFEISDSLPDNTLPGASATVDNVKIVNFYIKESEVVKELWDDSDLMDDDPSSTTRYLFDLLFKVSTTPERPDGLSAGDEPSLELAATLTSNEWY